MNSYWRKYFGWSKSRAEVFRDCPKRYSFQYLFKWERGRAAELAKFAGKLAPLAVHKGSLIHDEIARWIVRYRDRQEEDAPASLARLERTFAELTRRAAGRVLERCFERWGEAEAARELDRCREDALFQLDRFHREVWPRYRQQSILSCEVLERLEVDRLSMWVSADLVVRDDAEEVVIVDWKTGHSRHPAAESLQLSGYLLWARKKFGVPLEKIRGELVWLAGGDVEVDSTRRSDAQLAAFVETVREDTLAMLSLSDYAEIEAYPNEGRCRRCAFLPLCKDAATPLSPEVKERALRRLADSADGCG